MYFASTGSDAVSARSETDVYYYFSEGDRI